MKLLFERACGVLVRLIRDQFRVKLRRDVQVVRDLLAHVPVDREARRGGTPGVIDDRLGRRRGFASWRREATTPSAPVTILLLHSYPQTLSHPSLH